MISPREELLRLADEQIILGMGEIEERLGGILLSGRFTPLNVAARIREIADLLYPEEAKP